MPRLPYPVLVFALAACALARAETQPPVVAADTAAISRDEYAARRAELARRIGDGVVIAFGSVAPEADYLEFHQNANFAYLTGIDEPDALMVMPVRAGVGDPILFVHERDPHTEVWSGERLGPARATALTGMRARRLSEFQPVVDSLATAGARVHIVTGDDVPDVFTTPPETLTQTLIARNVAVRDASAFLRDLRGRKSAAELALIRRAVDITVLAHAAAAGTVAPGRYEYEVEAALERVFRSSGAERSAFASIVGSGPNSTVLHYIKNNSRMRAGEVVVVDIGASWRGYAGDVTRTYPVSGRFTQDQRAIYQIVRDAQAAAERAAVVGASSLAMNRAADSVIGAGLARLGLIDGPRATYDCARGSCPQFRLYYMHGLGHAIGLDVHDPGTSGVQTGQLALHDVFSIEPGIYVRRNLLEIIPNTPANAAFKARIAANVSRYADIGVRIEDDYIVTESGLEWISRAPREIDHVERAMVIGR